MKEQPAANRPQAQPTPDLPSLVEQTRSGDLDSFAELVRRFQHMAHAYAYSVLGDFHWAEDAAQEAFVEAYLHMADLRHPEAFPGWLRRIVYKHCDRLRRKPRVSEVPLDEAREIRTGVQAGMHDPLQALQQQEMRDRVMNAVRALPDPQREATMLFYINGYSQNEIAEFLEVPVTTVQKRLHDSRKKLKARMVDMVENTLKSNAPDEKFTEKVVEDIFEQILSSKSPTIWTPMDLSPDGRWLAITVRDIRSKQSIMDIETDSTIEGVASYLAGSQILLVDTKTGKSTSPFPKGSNSWSGRWSPDSKYMAVYVQHEGPPCLTIYDPVSGNFDFIREAPVNPYFGYEVPQWTPNGRMVVTSLAAKNEAEGEKHSGSGAAKELERRPIIQVKSHDPADPEESDKIEVQERQRRRRRLKDLGVICVEPINTRRIVFGRNITNWRLSPDGTRTALLCPVESGIPKALTSYDIVVLSLEDGESHIVASGVTYEFGALTWSPDSNRIAYLHKKENGHSTLYAVSADGSTEPSRISPEDDLVVGAKREMPRWSADGRYIYCYGWGNAVRYAADGSGEKVVYHDINHWVQPAVSPVFWSPDGKNLLAHAIEKEEGSSGFVMLDLDSGERKQFAPLNLNLSCEATYAWAVDFANNHFYTLASEPDKPSGVWRIDAKLLQKKMVGTINPKPKIPVRPVVKVIKYRAADGRELDAGLYLPPNYKDGVRLPLIVRPYGTDCGAARKAEYYGSGILLFSGQMSLLTARGYAVLDPDMPLPKGDHLRSVPGFVMPAIQRTIDLGYADPDRIGLIGHSYGAYCAIGMLTHSSIFKAAIAASAFVDNFTMFCGLQQRLIESHPETGLFGTPWEKRDKYIEDSPFFYLDRVRTPLLLVCGTQDRFSARESQMAYYALKRLGQRVEMRVYEGEDHYPGNWSAPSLRDLHRRVMEWFDTYLAPPAK